MTEHRTKLKTLLRELFQFDAADLDFGIYRIMNQRRAEIDDFVERGLLDAVAQEFALLQEGVVEEKREELSGLARQVRETLGESALDADGNIVETYAQIPLALRYVQKQEEIKRATVSAEAEAEIFNALYTFFSRYYDQGDFVTKRRYSRTHKYAIPYKGEEVLLYWANRDQYYVKTADTLTDYAFVITSHDGYRVRFKLAAADTEQGNVKGDQRYFLPVTESDLRGLGDLGGLAQYDEAGRELTLFFEYRPLADDESATYSKTRIQEKIITAERGRLLDAVPDVTLRGLLATPPAGKEVPLLDLHLTRWTRKATSDYFIHKDLQGFLERELDFYLKNEVMRLDDLDTENATRAEQYLTRLVVIKRLARKIIAFLAQIEDFEKALFEKLKFVLSSEWCVTLDRVPEDLLPQVVANDAQWVEWERLFGVRKPLGQDAILSYLAEHPTLTVDTALYDVAFKDALLAALSVRDGGLEAQRDGLLIHGENFQALTLLQAAYLGKVKCIYIDPPYNTGSDEFVYKDKLQHSSWLAMMQDRLRLAREVLAEDGVIFVSCDDNQQAQLKELMGGLFADENFVDNLVWQKKVSPSNDAKWFSSDHDYLMVYARSKSVWRPKRLKRTKTQRGYYRNPDNDPRGDWNSVAYTCNKSRQERPNLYYPIVNPNTGEEVWPKETAVWAYSRELHAQHVEQNLLYWGKTGKARYPRFKKFLSDAGRVVPRSIWPYSEVGHTQEATSEFLAFFPQGGFPSPKPSRLLKRVIILSSDDRSGDTILDFFAGSGTTAHAVISLNQDDSGERKYILVEQGGYFDTVLKPRIQKVVYAAEWKDGQPMEGSEGSSHAFQYLRLESYEDTLDNLDLDTEAAPAGLFPPERDDYLLRYFLDHETRQSRLNVEFFATPFDYQLRVRRNGVETRVGVDLVETAKFLLGLTVQARRVYEHQGHTYRAVFGTTGDQSVVVIWRGTAGLDLEAEAAFVQTEILRPPRSSETSEVWKPDRVYVNGDSHVPNAQPIEAVFMNAMRGAAAVRRGGS
jgi:adenine-specific DNA-methyltransferase